MLTLIFVKSCVDSELIWLCRSLPSGSNGCPSTRASSLPTGIWRGDSRPQPWGPMALSLPPTRGTLQPSGAPQSPTDTSGHFLPPSSPRLDTIKGKKRERGERGGGEGGGGAEGGRLVPHDRMQGGEGGSALGFCEGKALYPPVLTPRSTARLREGICEGK